MTVYGIANLSSEIKRDATIDRTVTDEINKAFADYTLDSYPRVSPKLKNKIETDEGKCISYRNAF